MDVSQIQSQLMREFVEFRDKRKLIKYYVSFQFVRKQQELAIWWKQKISFVLKVSGDIYMTPSKLKLIFTIHGLKPTPLKTLLNHFHQTSEISWKQKPPTKNPLIQTILNYIMNTSPNPQVLDDNKSKITVTDYHNEITKKMMEIIQRCYSKQEHIFQYKGIEQIAKDQLKLTANSVECLLGQMKEDGKILLDSIGNQRIILYSKFTAEMRNPTWVEVEKNKCMLNDKIQDFSRKIETLCREEQRLKEQAKKQLQLTQANTAKATNIKQKYLVPARNKKKKAEALLTRKKILEDTLFKLENNETNNITIQMMTTCQDLLRKNLRDPNQIDQIIFKSQETKEQQREIDENMKRLTQRQQDEDDVMAMLGQLEAEVEINKQLPAIKIEKKSVKVQIKEANQEKGRIEANPIVL